MDRHCLIYCRISYKIHFLFPWAGIVTSLLIALTFTLVAIPHQAVLEGDIHSFMHQRSGDSNIPLLCLERDVSENLEMTLQRHRSPLYATG
jgi:hypothetical protein